MISQRTIKKFSSQIVTTTLFNIVVNILNVEALGKCRICGLESRTISDVLGVCLQCLRRHGKRAVRLALDAHIKSREKLGLPGRPPRDGAVKCRLCVNECLLNEGERGFCGVMVCRSGRVVPVEGWDNAYVYWYLDPHPTNCVAFPVCPAVTGNGYPRYSLSRQGERGYYNLAVFYGGCNLNCLFCQNWEHWRLLSGKTRSFQELAMAAVNDYVTCICFFGGDPGPHVVHALKSAEEALRKKAGRILRICWETNGVVSTVLMRRMAKLSLETGGIVKVDFKAWTPEVYQALTGVDGVYRVRENIKAVAEMSGLRDDPPLLVVSTLLVPGYVDSYEVRMIARFLADLDRETPYVLLAFHPDRLLTDLPRTSSRHAQEALFAAKEEGLKRVFLGNVWLLGEWY